MSSEFRHEYKFRLSLGDYLAARSRLSALLQRDPHADANDEYFIRSVYFDNSDDKALREKLDGVDRREKFRIRWYNNDLSFIVLEKKEKLGGLCRKTECPITKEEAQRIFGGDIGFLKEHHDPLARELAAKWEIQSLRPRTVVDYRREPFIFPAGNVRVTLDRDIRGASFKHDILTNGAATLPAGDAVLMEVKYDEFLPDIVRDIVSLNARNAGAFSKYAAARGYN